MDYQFRAKWQEHKFKIDTGADVTVISEQEYLLKQDDPLTQTNRVLSGPSQQRLDVCGQFWETFQISSKVHNKRFTLFVTFAKHYLVDQLSRPYKLFNKWNLCRQTNATLPRAWKIERQLQNTNSP